MKAQKYIKTKSSLPGNGLTSGKYYKLILSIKSKEHTSGVAYIIDNDNGDWVAYDAIYFEEKV